MDLLSSKIVVLESEPQIPTIASVLSAVLLMEGKAEKGPINDPQLVTSFDEYEEIFGGFTAEDDLAVANYGYSTNGGVFCWVNRIVHYSDLTDPSAHTALKGSVDLFNSADEPGPAVAGPSAMAPFALPFDLNEFVTNPPANVLDAFTLSGDFVFDVGAGDVTATVTAQPAVLQITIPGGTVFSNESFSFSIDGGPEQTITVPAGEANAMSIAMLGNPLIVGGSAIFDPTTPMGEDSILFVFSDTWGSGGSIEITDPGTFGGLVTYTPGKIQGSGNVANAYAITIDEIKAIVEAEAAGLVVVDGNGDNTFSLKTTAVGSAASVQVKDTGDLTFGLPTTLENGVEAGDRKTLQIVGKYFGAYTNDITIRIEGATSGEPGEFNMKVIKGGVVKETYNNVDMASVVGKVNDPNAGSQYIEAVDLQAVGSIINRRPMSGTSPAMTGGDDGLTGLNDADYRGNQAGSTGLFAFDRVTNGTMLVVPGASDALAMSMLDYAATHRSGELFCFLDPPAGYTAKQMVMWVKQQLLESASGEHGALYWPRIKADNVAPSLFGTGDTITVPPSAWIAGVAARNDKRIGGIYEAPAGTGSGFGAIFGLRGVEDDPGGGSRHPVLDEHMRDLVYPKLINPITKLETTPWHIDGNRTLKSTGNFPTVGERRGVSYIQKTIKESLVKFRHRNNNKRTRRKVESLIVEFLTEQMHMGAFRSTDPEKAFRVSVAGKLNPTSKQKSKAIWVKVALATNAPVDWIILEFSQDMRGEE